MRCYVRRNSEMTLNGWLQILVFLALIFAVTKPLGIFMTRVFARERTFLDPVLRPIERLLYRVTGVDESHEMRWSEYATTMRYFTQMAGLAFHNFASAATGIVLAIAFIRGIARRQMNTLGNFWVDFVRCCLWVLLPFCIVGSLFLVSQGVVQNLKPYETVKLLEPQQIQKVDADGN